MNVIEARGLAKAYGGRRVVDDFAMTVAAGDIYGFVGKNGAGKSTVMKMICGEVAPTAGEVALFGVPTGIGSVQKTSGEGDQARRIGVLIEQPGLLPNLTAYQNLQAKALAWGIVDGPARCEEVLRLVGLSGAGKQKVRGFSLGMRQRLGLALALAGLGCAITAFCHNAIGSGITSSVGNLYVAAVAAAIGIFALPAFFFGMITPYVIRLRLAGLDTAGATVGRLYALSTAGSILGTFLGGFVLISWFSSTAILWSVAICMILLSLLNNLKKPALRLAVVFLFAFLAWQDKSYAYWQGQNGGQKLVETPYNSIRIMEGKDYRRNGEAVRLIATDPGYTQSGMLINDPQKLYFDYTRFYALGPAHSPEAKNILMLGGGGYSVPKWLLSGKSGLANPREMNLVVVELDPAMTSIAKSDFALKDDSRLKIRHEDARAFLNSQQDKYDLVFVDVFNSHYSVPFHVGTRQAAKEMARALAPGGMLLMNVISAVEGEDGRLFRSIYHALGESFEEVDVYCVSLPERPGEVQNLMLAAYHQKPAREKKRLAKVGIDPAMDEIEKMEATLYKKAIPDDVPALDDDFSPVDRYTLMLRK